MPANLKNPFGESCCDGGICNIQDMSAQPCGCDKGANWICEQHRPREVRQCLYCKVTDDFYPEHCDECTTGHVWVYVN